MQVVHLDIHKKRLWVFEVRVHHGMSGAVLFVVSILMMIHDWHDRWWTRDDP